MAIQQLAIRLYALTLWCFPAAHRREWAEVMVVTFEDMARAAYDQSGTTGLLMIWLYAFFDVVKASAAEHFANDNRGPSIMNDLVQIDTYRIQNTIGEGSRATVYRVQDAAGNAVALKLFNETDGPDFYDRELDNLGKINHPAAPRLLDTGTYGKQPYCVLELIEGEDWEKKVEASTATSEREAIEWALEICDFLHYLHGSETPLIHRSLKPGNIMVQRDGHIKVLDYGIMEHFAPAQDYPLIGTEGYSPPEQYVGRSDARSDIYALGASLYHLLTKRDPRKGAPFMFHFHPPRALNPTISEALEAVILKAVEHKPEDRYESASALRAALAECLPNERTAALPNQAS